MTSNALVVTAGAGTTLALDQLAVALFGVPLASVTAACTGALVPTLLLDREPIALALRRWLGSVAFSLSVTALVMLLTGFAKPYGIGIAAVLAMFARDLFSAIRGEVPPIVGALRARFFGPRPEEK